MRIKQNEYSAYDNKTEWLPVLHILREPLDLDNFLEAGKPGQVKLVIYLWPSPNKHHQVVHFKAIMLCFKALQQAKYVIILNIFLGNIRHHPHHHLHHHHQHHHHHHHCCPVFSGHFCPPLLVRDLMPRGEGASLARLHTILIISITITLTIIIINTFCITYDHNHHDWHLHNQHYWLSVDSLNQWQSDLTVSVTNEPLSSYITQAHKCTKMVKILWWKAKMGADFFSIKRLV